MSSLSNLKKPLKNLRKSKRVGRGNGSGLGKTSGRGQKGAGSRSGYKRRYTYEGGQFRQFMKLPHRGFSNVQFRKEFKGINLGDINEVFEDGQVVNLKTLREKGMINNSDKRVKLLGQGEITKKISFEVQAISSGAKEKLQNAKLSFTIDA